MGSSFVYCVDCGGGQAILKLNYSDHNVDVASPFQATDLLSTQRLQPLICLSTLPFTWSKGLLCVSQHISLNCWLSWHFHD